MVAVEQKAASVSRWRDNAGVAAAAALTARRNDPGRGPILAETGRSRIDLLERAIAAEVVPRLILAGRANPPCRTVTGPGAVTPTAADITALAALLRAAEDAPAAGFVEAMQSRGVTLESVYLDLLAPAARHLGVLWAGDRCDFASVTMALYRLHALVRALSPIFRAERDHREQGRRTLLVPVPGEQHTFGLSLVTEFFRRDGWSVRGGPVASCQELASMVRAEWFALVGLSLSTDSGLPALAACIRAVRRASRNPAIGVMVGGPVFHGRPDRVCLVGADASAIDGRQAALQAQSLLTLLASRN